MLRLLLICIYLTSYSTAFKITNKRYTQSFTTKLYNNNNNIIINENSSLEDIKEIIYQYMKLRELDDIELENKVIKVYPYEAVKKPYNAFEFLQPTGIHTALIHMILI